MKRFKRVACVATALGCAALLVGCGTFASQLGGALFEGMADSVVGIDPAEQDRQREADEFAKEMMKSDSERK